MERSPFPPPCARLRAPEDALAQRPVGNAPRRGPVHAGANRGQEPGQLHRRGRPHALIAMQRAAEEHLRCEPGRPSGQRRPRGKFERPLLTSTHLGSLVRLPERSLVRDTREPDLAGRAFSAVSERRQPVFLLRGLDRNEPWREVLRLLELVNETPVGEIFVLLA